MLQINSGKLYTRGVDRTAAVIRIGHAVLKDRLRRIADRSALRSCWPVARVPCFGTDRPIPVLSRMTGFHTPSSVRLLWNAWIRG
jgi:hypothetical protein